MPRIVKELGDGLLLFFPSPDAAVSSCVSILEGFERAEAADEMPLWVRVGLHRGRPSPRGDDLVGHDVNVAARIVDIAAPGELLCSGTLLDAADAPRRRRRVRRARPGDDEGHPRPDRPVPGGTRRRGRGGIPAARDAREPRRILGQPLARRGRGPAPDPGPRVGSRARDPRWRAARGRLPRGAGGDHGGPARPGRGLPAASHRRRRRDLVGRADRSRDARAPGPLPRPPRRADVARRGGGARERVPVRGVRAAPPPARSRHRADRVPHPAAASAPTTAS